MTRVLLRLCFALPLVIGGCAADGSSFRGPQADMTEKYPRKPFVVKRRQTMLVRTGPFIMPPGLPSFPEPAASIQRPMKGTGENGQRPAYPPLTDTEATYGR